MSLALAGTVCGALALSWEALPAGGSGAGGSGAGEGHVIVARLAAVSAVSTDDVWAVGSVSTDGVERTLVKHWDGSSWTRVASVDPDPDTNRLLGVTALAPDDVWAVGSSAVDGVQQPLIEHWDGRTWSQVDSPEGADLANELTSVAAVSPRDIWAAGYQNFEFGDAEVILQHWDGHTWSEIENENPAYLRRRLTGVTAIARTNVWAVGYGYDDEEAGNSPISLHWNGSDWSQIPIKVHDKFDDNPLRGVDAISRHNIWAVGYHTSGIKGDSLVEHFTGSIWRSSPAPSADDTYLNGVSAVATNDVWAVGYTDDPARPFVLHRGSGGWSEVGAPSQGGASSLFGVDAVASDDVWAVGTSGAGRIQRALAEHWDGTSWQIAPSR